MKKVVKLTESDLVRIVKRVVSEQSTNSDLGSDIFNNEIVPKLTSAGFKQKQGAAVDVISYQHPKGVTLFLDKKSKKYVVYFRSPGEKQQDFRLDRGNEAVNYALSFIK
jgi:hypothetical protein